MDTAYIEISAKDQLLPKNEATRNGKNPEIMEHSNTTMSYYTEKYTNNNIYKRTFPFKKLNKK